MKKKKYYVNFLGEKCQLVKDRYNTGGLCLNLICKNGEPMATATVNMPCCGLNDGEICIKDYSENEGMLHSLLEAKIVQLAGRIIKSGFAEIPVVKLLIDPEEM